MLRTEIPGSTAKPQRRADDAGSVPSSGSASSSSYQEPSRSSSGSCTQVSSEAPLPLRPAPAQRLPPARARRIHEATIEKQKKQEKRGRKKDCRIQYANGGNNESLGVGACQLIGSRFNLFPSVVHMWCFSLRLVSRNWATWAQR